MMRVVNIMSKIDDDTPRANPDPLRTLFPNIKKGAGGTFHHFFSKFENSLLRMTIQESLGEAVNWLRSLARRALAITPCQGYGQDGTEFFQTLLNEKPLWTTLIAILSRRLPNENKESLDAHYSDIVRPVIRLVSFCARTVTTREEVLVENPFFMRHLIRSGLFDALDVSLPLVASRINIFGVFPFCFLVLTGMSSHLHVAELGDIVSALLNTVERHPTLLPVLRPHLPRPYTVRALWDAANTRTDVRELVPNITFDSATCSILIDPPAMPKAKMIVPAIRWKLLDLECAVDKECGRRGCRRRRASRCKACQTTEYCGMSCQKQ